MNKNTTKKIIGGTLIVALLATIGAVLVTADTDDSTDNVKPFNGFGFERHMQGQEPFCTNLTEEQQTEIQALRESLTASNATAEEIREAINEKLREFGIDIPTRDEMLDSQIEQTTQQLEILQRQKELRNEGYSWDEISDIISEEYGMELPNSSPPGEMGGRGFHGPGCRGEFNQDFAGTADTEL